MKSEMEEKVKVVIDKSRWRTGGDKESCNHEEDYLHYTGEGVTALSNPEGYMCCLGFVCLAAGLRPDQILDKGAPESLSVEDLEVVKDLLVYRCDENGEETECLSDQAVNINDAPYLPIGEKIVALKRVFEDSRYTLIFVDGPTTATGGPKQ